MRGIIAAAGYVPYRRLRRERIAEVLGGNPGRGTRAVASYDEDTTTMGVEAGRLALRQTDIAPSALWFSSATPSYADKTNATAIHAALRCERDVVAADFCGAPRSATAAFAAALASAHPVLLVTADIRTGLPRSADETEGGDGAAAVLVGGEDDGPVLAELVGTTSVTEEFLDRWRQPGEPRSKQWEERFGEGRYVPLATETVKRVTETAGISTDDVAHAVVTGLHARAVRRVRSAVANESAADDLAATVGNTGTAHPFLMLADVLERAAPDELILVLALADGADAFLFRATEELASWTPERTVRSQIEAGDDGLAYADFLTWRGHLTPEPPRRPEPARVSAPAAARRTDWKFGFVGSKDRSSGAVHLPPARVSFEGGGADEMDPAPMADVPATVATFTVDRLAWSPSPPTVFAVLDFDGGGRFACELTDVEPSEVRIGDRVEMTFRVLNTADGIRNYFWKARPVRG